MSIPGFTKGFPRLRSTGRRLRRGKLLSLAERLPDLPFFGDLSVSHAGYHDPAHLEALPYWKLGEGRLADCGIKSALDPCFRAKSRPDNDISGFAIRLTGSDHSGEDLQRRASVAPEKHNGKGEKGTQHDRSSAGQQLFPRQEKCFS